MQVTYILNRLINLKKLPTQTATHEQAAIKNKLKCLDQINSIKSSVSHSMMKNKISMDERKIWKLQKCYFNYHIQNVTSVINRKV